MAIAYCEYCHLYIDLDQDDEHFNDNGECIEYLEDKEG